jgi:tRNA(fMet)-specific endonuclease VapC
MKYLQDANTCIRLLNGTSQRIRPRMASLADQDIALCSVIRAELLYGALKSGRPDRNLQRLRPFFRRFVSLPFDDASAEAYGQIRADLEKAGTPIGPNDLCIAAIAKTNDLTLITHNLAEFKRVDQLGVEDWE